MWFLDGRSRTIQYCWFGTLTPTLSCGIVGIPHVIGRSTHIPNPDAAIIAARSQGTAATAVRQSVNHSRYHIVGSELVLTWRCMATIQLLTAPQLIHLLSCTQVPHMNDTRIISSGGIATGRTYLDNTDSSSTSIQEPNTTTRLYIPQPSCPVLTSRQDVVAVGMPFHCIHTRIGMTRE